MGKRGPKPKPSAMKAIEGNPGRRPINTEIDLKSENPFPSPPRHLGKIAKGEWKRVGPGYWGLGVLTEYNLQVFAAYCQAVEKWVDSSLVLEEMRKKENTWHKSFMVKTTNGNIIQNPIISVIKSAAEEMRKMAAELGFDDVPKKMLELGVSGKKKQGKFGQYGPPQLVKK